MVTSLITSKGQTTIPQEIRDLLRVKPGDRLAYSIRDGQVIVSPMASDILAFRGSLKAAKPLDFKGIRRRMVSGIAARAVKKGRVAG